MLCILLNQFDLSLRLLGSIISQCSYLIPRNFYLQLEGPCLFCQTIPSQSDWTSIQTIKRTRILHNIKFLRRVKGLASYPTPFLTGKNSPCALVRQISVDQQLLSASKPDEQLSCTQEQKSTPEQRSHTLQVCGEKKDMKVLSTPKCVIMKALPKCNFYNHAPHRNLVYNGKP